MSRTNTLIQIRPNITTVENNLGTSETEKFQNKVLRPILKFQHELLCYTFINSPIAQKYKFEQRHKDQKRNFIIITLKTNQNLKLQIVQSIISLMAIEELIQFYSNKSEYQKRIISMATHRLIDGLMD